MNINFPVKNKKNFKIFNIGRRRIGGGGNLQNYRNERGKQDKINIWSRYKRGFIKISNIVNHLQTTFTVDTFFGPYTFYPTTDVASVFLRTSKKQFKAKVQEMIFFLSSVLNEVRD